MQFQILWSSRGNGNIISNMFNKEIANCHSAASRKHQAGQSWLAMAQTYLLIIMVPCQIHKLYLRPRPKQRENHPTKFWSITLLRTTVSPEVYRNVLFMHDILGCYTTSGVEIDRKAALTPLSTSAVFREQLANDPKILTPVSSACHNLRVEVSR